MSWKRWNYLFGILFISSILLLVVSAEYLLYRLNENLNIGQSITKQLEDNSLYGRYLIGQQELYKQEMTILQKPEILILGSSRVMMFRKEFFRENIRFYNAGGAMPSIQHGIEFINAITQKTTPKVVILGVDLWWLNDNYIEQDNRRWEAISQNLIHNRLFLYGSLTDNLMKGSLKRYGVDLLANPNYKDVIDPYSRHKTIGLDAALYGNGFRVDGSYQYGRILSGKLPAYPDYDFKQTLTNIQRGAGRFISTDGVSAEKRDNLSTLLAQLKSKKIQVIVIAQPFPRAVYEALYASPSHHRFVQEFRDTLKAICEEEHISFYDFSNIEWYGSNDAEAIDGYHASETSYARLILAMSNDNVLKEYIDAERIKRDLTMTHNPAYSVPVQTE